MKCGYIPLLVLAMVFTSAARLFSDESPQKTSKRISDQTQAVGQFALRGYRHFSHSTETHGSGATAATIHKFTFEDPSRAVIFASKVFSDYELTVENKMEVWNESDNTLDVIALSGDGFIVPVLEQGKKIVHVLSGTDKAALTVELQKLLLKKPLRRTELSHPLFMDKWDRYCFGTWQSPNDFAADPDHKTPAPFYEWMGRIGLNPQINDVRCADMTMNDNTFTWLRHYFDRYGVKFQNIEWLESCADLYNRNPFLSSFPGSGVMPRWTYYGEEPHAPGLLRDVQNATAVNLLKTMDGDEKLMAILDPNGEVEMQLCFYGEWSEYGPVQRRNFVRYLRDYRKFSLKDVSLRYTGKADSFKSWDDVQMVDWKTFYGWTGTSLDLAGEWRVMRDDASEGLRAHWDSPAYDDSDWARLYYPGDATLQTLFFSDSKSTVWMRRTVTVDPARNGQHLYLTVAPLCPQPVEVFVNGRRVTSITGRVRGLKSAGQIDISDAVQSSSKLTIALRMSGEESPCGPIFVTSRKMEDFPTSDPCLNARRFDHFDFLEWAVADSVRTTLLQVRSVDRDRPIKIHAYGQSAYGWKVVKEMGGYAHHTGSGPGWSWNEPRQYGATRNLQDSSETGGPVSTVRDAKGLMGNLIFMGKNAHDYFYNIQSITTLPGMKKWLEDRLPAVRIMGRANTHMSPIASIRGLQNTSYIGEYAREESWRHGYDLVRGGEMTPLLDELRIKEGGLPYPAIFDEGTLCWDNAFAKSLENYVAQGGVLFLQAGSGRHSDAVRDAYPGARLAGVSIEGERGEDVISIVSKDDPLLSTVTGKSEHTTPHSMAKCVSIRPLEGTSILGTFKNGAPAVTKRALGKGSVYYCAAGVWPDFIRKAVVDHLGLAIHAKATGGGTDLLRTLESNNGSEELLMLRGLGKPGSVEWTLDFTPSRVYDPVTGKDLPATIKGNTVTLNVNIPDWDFAWFAVRRGDPEAQFSHWLTRQSEMWSGLVKGTPPASVKPFRSLDLNRGWLLVQTNTKDEATRLAALSDAEAAMKPTPLILWDAPGLDVKPDLAVGLYRRHFDLPEGWKAGDLYELEVDGRNRLSPLRGFPGPVQILINGVEVWKGDKLDAKSLDLSGNMKKSGNKLEIIHEGQGIMPSICLIHSTKPSSTIPLTGEWRAVDSPQTDHAFQFPGKIETSFIYKDLTIPAELSSKEVWVKVETEEQQSSKFLIVNGRKRFEAIGGRGPTRALEINVTPDVRFGAPNRIIIGSQGMESGWSKSIHVYKSAVINFYEPGSWNADGKGIREALSPRELATAIQSEKGVALYPLIQQPVSKSPVQTMQFTKAELDSYVPPEPVLDLKLDAATGQVSDVSKNKIPVTSHGTCESFSERQGKIRGTYLKDITGASGWLELPDKPLRNLLAGKPFTLCAWIKPILQDSDSGTFLQVGNTLSWSIGLYGTKFCINDDRSNGIAIDNVIAPRQWQFLTLVMDGDKARLWIDGVDVGEKQWTVPFGGWNAPLCIGSGNGKFASLNAMLAGFTIHPKALDETEVVKIYLKSRERFATNPGDAWTDDDQVGLGIVKGKLVDCAETPSVVETGSGVTIAQEDGRAVVRFDGTNSHLLFNEHPKVHVLGKPFSVIMDIKPDAGSAGCVFRRFHDLCLYLDKDGSLHFDADIGQHNAIVFPKVVSFGQWNRLMLTYNGATASVFKDGKLLEQKSYPGHLSRLRRLMLCIGADNTAPRKEGRMLNQIPMSLREFRIVPKVLSAVPPPDGRFGQ